MNAKDIREDLVKRMQHWQKVERESVASTASLLEQTSHPLLRLVLEIIRRDSELHDRVQQFIIDHVAIRPVTLSPDDLAGISAPLDHHLRLEDQMVEAVNTSVARIRGHKMLVEEYLLDFLVQDEKKHAALLRSLDSVKRGIYPYA